MITRSNQNVFVLVLLLAFNLFASSISAAEGYYKWQDTHGNPQHSDRPPPSGVAYEYVSTETGMKRRVEASANTNASAAPAMPAAVKTENVAEKQAKIAKNPEYCEQARSNLETLNSSARVRIRENDEVRYLTEEEKDIQRRKANDTIAVHCE